MFLSGVLLFSFAKEDHVHHSSHEEEREPHEEGVPAARQGHDERRRGTEPSDAQRHAKDGGPDDEALGDFVGLTDMVDVAGE